MSEIKQPENGDIFRTAPLVTVQTRQNWEDEWIEQPRAHCLRVQWGANPQGSSAVLEVMSGAKRTREAPGVLQHLEPLHILGDYVRITIQPQDEVNGELPEPLYWYGICTEDVTKRDGVKAYGSTRVLTSQQRFQAIGLESMLDYIYIDKSYFPDATNATTYRINRPLTFNEPHAFGDKGNRSALKGPDDVHLFTEDLADAEYWSTRQIVLYLMHYFRPVDFLGFNHVPWELSLTALATLPTWDKPIVRCEGRTLRQILDELIDRRHLLAWQVTVDEEEEPAKVYLDAFSFLPEAITLPSGAEQAENFDPVQLDFDPAIDVEAQLTQSGRQLVGQMVVRGARERSCFSLAHADATLIADWSLADEVDYENGPAVLPATTAEQERAIVEYRRADRFRQVYSYFCVPDDWDYRVGDGLNNPETMVLISSDLEMLNWVCRPTLRFTRELFQELATTKRANGAQDAPPPFAVIKTESGDFRLIDQLAETDGMLDRGAGAGRMWAASLRIRADSPGIIVRVSGAQQHVIAPDEFSGEYPGEHPMLRWQDMIVTVAAELDSHVEQAWPELSFEQTDQAKRAVVDIGDAGRLDYVVPSTVTGVNNGELVRHAGGYVRDDREWMQDLARYVHEWYGTTRKAFKFSMRQVLDLLRVGQLITTLGSDELEEEVNSVVVGVTFDFQQQHTFVDTAFGNLDMNVVVGWFAPRRS